MSLRVPTSANPGKKYEMTWLKVYLFIAVGFSQRTQRRY